MEDEKNDKYWLETSALNAPVTFERKINKDLDVHFPKPYMVRALVAVDVDHPNGSSNHEHRDFSVLQQHVAYFDRNRDGIVYPWETYQGFRAIGFNKFLSFIASFAIHLFFSIPTWPGWVPSILLPIYISNIHKAKHGSDTQVYDTEGRFDPAKFDAIFSKYAITHGNALTRSELRVMLHANKTNAFGRLASLAEWQFLYLLAKDEHGLLHREAIRGLYDGSLFEQCERKLKSSKAR